MSSAATIHDGCGSLVHLLLLRIILIVYMSAWHAVSAHVSLFTFVAHSYGKRVKTVE